MSKKYYNPEGCEILDETIFGAEPTGFVNFNKPRYNWSNNIYNLMENNSWFPGEVDTSNEGKNVSLLSENELWRYKLTFAQLSFNDSAQEEYLSDFRALATNSLVKSTLSLQIMQEVNHSKSYAVLLDAAGNSEEVFNLYKENDALNTKNKLVAEQFAKYIQGNSADKMILSAMASVNLEGIFFLTGFGNIYMLGDKVPGARDMIQFIARDELNTHLPLFSNIYKTIAKENKLKTSTIDSCYEMINDAVKIELDYGLYLLEQYPIMGDSKELITDTIHNYANDRLSKIGLDTIFDVKDETYMQKLVKTHLDFDSLKSNFFEGNVKSYSKNAIDFSDI